MDSKTLTSVKSLFLTTMLLLGAILVVSSTGSSSGLTGPEFSDQYINGDAEVEIIGYLGSGGDVIVPSSIDGKPVTSLADYSFSYKTLVLTISLPSSVTNIGLYAFQSCPSLRSIDIDGSNPSYSSEDGVLYDKAVTTLNFCPAGRVDDLVIPSTVTIIGSYACYECRSLRAVTIPLGVTSIGDSAFSYNSGLLELDIPNSVVSIGYASFERCTSLRNVTIPASVTNINSNAFAGCTSMVNINVSSDNLNYASASGILYDKGLVTLVQCPAGKVGAVSIEGTVTRIASYAFSACAGITSINLPSGLSRIDYSAFSHCTSLTAIDAAQQPDRTGQLCVLVLQRPYHDQHPRQCFLPRQEHLQHVHLPEPNRGRSR